MNNINVMYSQFCFAINYVLDVHANVNPLHLVKGLPEEHQFNILTCTH